MKDISEFKARIEPAIGGILNNWRVWAGDDQIRALHIGFDSFNSEIAVSLLTDREPYLEECRLSPFGARWPVADWRLYGLNASHRYRFADAEEVLHWMRQQAELLETEALTALNEKLKEALFQVVTGPVIRSGLSRFRRVASPFKIRVEWFFDDAPMDAEYMLSA
jgi:hypothetical protein